MFTKIKYFLKTKLSKLNLHFLPNINMFILYDVNKYRNLYIYITIIIFFFYYKEKILYLFHFLICK